MPTSQIFLGPDEGLDTRDFDPWRQRHIYDYGRVDAPGGTRLAPGLAGFFLAQVRRQIGVSEAALQHLRNLRAAAMNGEVSGEEAGKIAAGEAASWQEGADPAADRAAFSGLAAEIAARE